MTAPFKLSAMLGHLEDLVSDGTVPRTVTSFGDLHSYLDANCLGGLCEDEVFDGLIAHFGGREQGSMPEGMLDLLNKYHDAIDLLIKSGFFLENSK